jgi:hypothetical protein
MHTQISRYHATASKDVLARLALQRASIMHLVDLKRGGYSPCRTELRIGRLTDRPISRRCKQFADEPAPEALAADRALGSILCESSPHR